MNRYCSTFHVANVVAFCKYIGVLFCNSSNLVHSTPMTATHHSDENSIMNAFASWNIFDVLV